MRLGNLVPHFGSHASRNTIIRLSQRCEEFGFDSLWVRDHLIWSPHDMEGSDKTFIDAFVTLSAIAAVTQNIALGTAVVIPIRWPLKLAQNFASLSFISGGPVIAGIGLGFNPDEFQGAGLNVAQREEILIETIAILRDAWDDGIVDFKGEVFNVASVELLPTPRYPIPIVYGGSTQKAVRRAVDHADGWYPARLPLKTLKARLNYMREYAQEGADRMYTIVQPLTVVADSRQAAEALVPIDEIAHSSAGAKFWEPTESGEFRTLDDLGGLIICGNPEQVAEQVLAFFELGIDEFVFDLRLQFDHYESALEMIGGSVLPLLKREMGT